MEREYSNQRTLTPLGWSPSLLIFLVTALMLRVTHYHFVPAINTTTGNPYFFGYLIGWVSTMFLFVAASFTAYKLEGNPSDWGVFRMRYRLHKMEKSDWIWTLAVILFAIVTLTALSFTQPILQGIPLFSPHPSFPPDLVDMGNNLTPGVIFGMTLHGKCWVVGIYFVGWIFNIIGEEFWYRGWMLPKQETAFGNFAWVINGLMFNFQHTFQPWNLIALLPGSLLLSFAVQKRKNTWISLVWHGLLNISLFVFIIIGVIG